MVSLKSPTAMNAMPAQKKSPISLSLLACMNFEYVVMNMPADTHIHTGSLFAAFLIFLLILFFYIKTFLCKLFTSNFL